MSNDPIIIIGGGFGGVYTARELLKHGHSVLLISETNYFTFTPLLHEVATGSLVTHDVIFEYESFFKSPQFEFIRGRADHIDRKRQSVSVDGEEYSYSYLVIATGSTTNFYSFKGEENAYVLKDVEDAIRLKGAILNQAQDHEQEVTVTVVGGGPTGIELIFDIEQMLRALKRKEPDLRYVVQLVHAQDTFCRLDDSGVQGYLRKAMKKVGIIAICNSFAQEITKNQIKTTTGTFPSDVTVMAAGVRPNTDVLRDDITLDAHGHVPVNDHLQLLDDDRVFALGDIIVIDGVSIPMLAQTATREAKVVAENIDRLKKSKKLVSYTPKVVGMLFSLGYGKGIGKIYGITVRGIFAWCLWRTVYLFKTPGIANKFRVAFSWTLNLFQGRNLTEL